MKERSNGTRCTVANLVGSMADELVIEEMKNISLNQSSLSNKLNHHKQTINSVYKKILIKKMI